MKNIKKLPAKQLEKFSAVFMQLGLVLVLFIVYVTLEHQTEVKTLAETFKSDESKIPYVIEDTKTIIFKRAEKPKPKVIKTPKVFHLDKIKQGNDDVIETILPDDLKDDTIETIDPDQIIEVHIIEPFVDDIDFRVIEDAPIYKGCEGLSKKENKICFEKKIKKFVQRNFDGELAQEIGLHTGKHKIYTQFIINKKGEVVDVKIKAPHIKLKKEVRRIMKKIPKFTPGKQRKKPVKVRYTLPIAFSVQ